MDEEARTTYDPAVGSESGTGTPAGVFIVEDQVIMRETYRMMFKFLPCVRVCGTAGSGEEALEALPEAGADLVLVDLSLPGMSGIELVRKIAEAYPRIRILVTSGYSDREHVQESLAAGAHAFVPKGNIAELEAEIKRLLP